jgi:signal transduction histidine kinase
MAAPDSKKATDDNDAGLGRNTLSYLEGARVLLVDDDPQDRQLAARELRQMAPGIDIQDVRTEGELTAALDGNAFDIAVTDYQLQWSTGLEVLKRIKEVHPGRPVVMFTASGSEEIAVAAMKAGLDDYLTKSLKHFSRLPYLVGVALERAAIRDELERARRSHRDALETEIQRKNDFLATLAHELRNPLAPIRYAARLIREGAKPSELAQARAMIERQSAQMARLLDDLLDFSRLTRDMIELKRETLDLRHIVEEAVSAALPVLESMHHRVQLELPGNPLWMSGDATRLNQILGNLLQNAARYTEPGGLIRINALQEGHEALICVRDTGIGIAAEVLPHVFDLFTQGPGAEKRHVGLGIGLSVVKRLTELHGGTVSAESAGPATGSLFTVRLPLAEAPLTGRTADWVDTADAPPTAVGGRILIVDDNPDIADSLAMLLRDPMRAVAVAYDGDQAMRISAALQPNFIVLDLGMPKMDGYDLARWIREQPWGQNAYLVAVTGWGQEQHRQRTRAAGFNEHLVKPVDPETLLSLLRSQGPFTGAETPDDRGG